MHDVLGRNLATLLDGTTRTSLRLNADKPVRFEERYGELHITPRGNDRFEGTEFGRPVVLPRRYAVIGVSRADWGSIAFAWERTTDPDVEDPDDFDTPEVDANVFTSVVASARLGEHHDATLFAGERRGGPACTAGTCYVVEPFRGVELRLTSRS